VFDRFAAEEWISSGCLFLGRGMTKSSAASFSHFIVWPPSYQKAAVFPSSLCGLSWFEWGDGDAAFEDKVDVVADSFRPNIIFRLPAPTFMYHGIALDVNPFCLSGSVLILREAPNAKLRCILPFEEFGSPFPDKGEDGYEKEAKSCHKESQGNGA
jgi:hypothetical protein